MSAERETANEAAGGMVDAALEIVRQRRETKRALRDALLRRDTEEVYTLAGRLVGVTDEVSDRTDKGLN